MVNQFVCGDCLDVMSNLGSESVDLVVTSPPYNLLCSTGGGFSESGKWASAGIRNGYSDYSDNIPHDQYVQWQRSVLSECMRLIKDDGAIFYNHKWRVQDGLLQTRDDIVSGFPVRQIIIWSRGSGMNFNDSYFVPTYEVIYMIAKPKFVLRKGANAVGDVWRIAAERGNDHPAPFPLELAMCVIRSTTAKLVLDPFGGSGTVAIAANKLGRNFVYIDVSKTYCDMATKRFEKATSQLQLF